jgi:hypothetical protein
MLWSDESPRAAEAPHSLLEEPRRLSESLLWKLQRNYFDQRGIRAWNEGEVPYYITNNPWFASAFAQVVFGWLRDCRAGAGCGPIDLREPVHIVELGCGNGRFGYLFLHKLLDLLERSPLRDTPIRYVYTDCTEYNLDILRSHPFAQPLVQAGLLDFARFDLETDRELHLTHSGETLNAANLTNPLAVLANYVFDGVRSDCFRIAGGELQESLARVTSAESGPDLDDPSLIETLTLSFEQRPTQWPYYNDPEWDHILDSWRQSFDDTVLLFPCAALQCLRHLRELSRERLLLVSADKGYAREESLAGRPEPFLNTHGSFSFMVNYHAIGQYVANSGGEFMKTSHLDSSFQIAACLYADSLNGSAETRLAFQEAMEDRGPDDFFRLKKAAEKNYASFTPDELLSYLRLSGWDHNILLGSFPALLQAASRMSTAQAEELRTAARMIWETHFLLHEPDDLAFHLGALLLEANWPLEALDFFKRSEEIYGPDSANSLNMALCYRLQNRWEDARREAERALDLDPEHNAARDLLIEFRESGH